MYELKDKEMIFVFTGPNGAGRKTIADMAGVTLTIKQVLSYTTRDKRPTETEAQDYFFITEEEFLIAQHNNDFIEVLEIDGNLYGIKSKDIQQQLQTSGYIYLILNRYGAEMLKSLYGAKVKLLFIYTDRVTTINRQRERGDSEEIIARYMSHYEEEMEYRTLCEHVYENTDMSHTIYTITKTLESYLERNLQDLD